jgi:excisionase family DNA binding protein
MNIESQQERLTFDVPQVGRLLGLSRNNTYELVKTGHIHAIRLGKRLLVPKSEVERLLAAGDGAAA